MAYQPDDVHPRLEGGETANGFNVVTKPEGGRGLLQGPPLHVLCFLFGGMSSA